ncbi:lysR family transcription regulator domain protein [Janthinobacterium agaricidamnosum NBRC 102515 = DSM 9628]|uniref:LysR family transcription regulator domain protein n=1 Tax=Janthinobacterium agaricidamnosum NBRC 102515 = DSM 9628 TaxID=1349767 RepID=W0VA29_9BURK|nr:lysR family transcription regulator domain protein [Janthinobacterium agaricidamnosum NBRC 102515 = DSM 9628]
MHRLAGEQLDLVRIIEPELHWQVAHVSHRRYLSHAARAWLEVCQSVLGASFVHEAQP